jgi:hypothetical protein
MKLFNSGKCIEAFVSILRLPSLDTSASPPSSGEESPGKYLNMNKHALDFQTLHAATKFQASNFICVIPRA